MHVVAVADHLANGTDISTESFNSVDAKNYLESLGFSIETNISIPGNATVNRLALNLDEVRRMLESGQKFGRIKDITTFFGKTFATQGYSYDFAIYKAIQAKKFTTSKEKTKQAELKKYIFIEFIKRKPYGNKLLIKVKDEVKLVIDATPGYEPYDRQKIISFDEKGSIVVKNQDLHQLHLG